MTDLQSIGLAASNKRRGEGIPKPENIESTIRSNSAWKWSSGEAYSLAPRSVCLTGRVFSCSLSFLNQFHGFSLETIIASSLKSLKLWRSEERRVGKECRSRWS